MSRQYQDFKGQWQYQDSTILSTTKTVLGKTFMLQYQESKAVPALFKYLMISDLSVMNYRSYLTDFQTEAGEVID
jgi:hypothetical protein